MGDFFTTIMLPFELLVAWIMYGFHRLWTAVGLSPTSGINWALSIVGLVLVMRAAMIPLFVKQIKSQRKMMLIQPQLQKIQAKYKGKTDPESRQAMTQETMALYKEEGTNPFSSCLPLLAQSPFFFGLFQVLNGLRGIAEGTRNPVGPITQAVASQAESATLFGSRLSESFVAATTTNTRVLTIILIIWMSATTFIMQKQMMLKNTSAATMENNPMMNMQKTMLYVIPVIFAISGINFPVGVLLYWFTTNLWTIGQQTYVLRNMPTPGSAAEQAYHERLARKGKPVPGAPMEQGSDDTPEDAAGEGSSSKTGGQRQQPKGKQRAKKQGPPRPQPNGPTDPAEPSDPTAPPDPK